MDETISAASLPDNNRILFLMIIPIPFIYLQNFYCNPPQILSHSQNASDKFPLFHTLQDSFLEPDQSEFHSVHDPAQIIHLKVPVSKKPSLFLTTNLFPMHIIYCNQELSANQFHNITFRNK